MEKESFSIENVQAQMRKGTLEFSVLLIIGRGEVYASEIIKKLIEADLIVVEGTLYPLLSRLKRMGLVEYRWEESPSGPPRKYYSLTEGGVEVVRRLQTTWNELNESIITLIKQYEKST